MRLIIDSKKLLRGLEVVKPVVTTSKIVPICDNVLIRSDKDCIALIATNINHSIITQIQCEVRGKINALIPFIDIYNICKGLTDQSISIEFGEKTLVTSANGSYTIGGIDNVEDFPTVEVIQPELEMTIPSSEVGNIKNRSVKFIHPDETHYNKHGVCFDFGNDILNVVATNNNCLSLHKVPCKSNPGTYLIDKGTIDLLQIFSFGIVNLKFSDKKIQVDNDDTILISPLREDKFVNYKSVLVNTDCSIEVNRISLLNTLLRSLKFSLSEITHFTISESLEISSGNVNYEKDFKESLDIIELNGFEEGHTVKLNSKDISNYLSVCDSETIIISSVAGSNMYYFNEPNSESLFLAMKFH